MPAAVPIIAAFASGSVGAVIAGTAGLAAYASVAGAVLVGVGALTGKKDLTRLGSILSIGGGIAGALGLGGGAAAAGEAAASSGMDLAADAASGGNSLAGAANALGGASQPALDAAAAAGMDGGAGATGAMNTAPVTATPASPLVPEPAPNGLVAAGRPSGVGTQQLASGAATAPVTPQPVLNTGRISEFAKSTTSDELASWWEKAKKAGNVVGDFINKNPAVVKVGGDMLSSMYGPQAERMDWEKSLYERARANLNSPIAMARTKPVGGK